GPRAARGTSRGGMLWRMRSASAWQSSLRLFGQVDGEGCADSHLTFTRDRAAVRFDRSLHDRQTQPRSFDRADIARAVERLEQMGQVLFGDTDAIIGDTHDHFVRIRL